jgi:hypothetical protein
MIGRGNLSTRRKPTPVPLSPLQTPHAARREPEPPRWKQATNRLSYGTAKIHVLCYETAEFTIIRKLLIIFLTFDGVALVDTVMNTRVSPEGLNRKKLLKNVNILPQSSYLNISS